uniref:Uncharacterized protein n=1 Tax=Chelonoidis abingdonii TaxID=106734 RepID=A0A8C0J4B8_CHEAB
MPHYQTWEEFTRAAEKLYLADPMKVHSDSHNLSRMGLFLILKKKLC